MVSQSRLYLALLAVMAIMAFWLGLWCSAVSNYEDFREPKPRAADEIFFVEVEKKPVSKNFNSKFHLMILMIFLNKAVVLILYWISVSCILNTYFIYDLTIFS